MKYNITILFHSYADTGQSEDRERHRDVDRWIRHARGRGRAVEERCRAHHRGVVNNERF